MRTGRLNYHLPPELIAQQPIGVRSRSRLLVFDRSSGKLVDSSFSKIGQFLTAGDCLVLNDTKVLPARFFAHRGSGARLEGLFLTEPEPAVWQVMLKGTRKVKTGETIYLGNEQTGGLYTAEVLEKLGEGRCLLRVKTHLAAQEVLGRVGFAPLPPYIKRGDDAKLAATDKKRYQTVYARRAGAVAAPTAGLHFTAELIEQLQKTGIRFAFVTLHVGPGTFRPVTAEDLEEHKMEPERFVIDSENAGIINAARRDGGRIIAVGTTSVRVLESVAADSGVAAYSGQTNLFITPGYKFKLTDAMVTNFHLPKSTLLALVAAFAGLENIFAAYRHAVESRYRFYSYGDAMLIA
jgi:S-adenosylmethionine:tRNA ribosyltransferase-isomerase